MVSKSTTKVCYSAPDSATAPSMTVIDHPPPPAVPPRSSPVSSPTHLLVLQSRSVSFWENDVLVAFITLFIWPVGLFLFSSFGLVCAYHQYWVKVALHYLWLRRRKDRQPITAESSSALETGLYWYGVGNICEREQQEGHEPSKFFDPSRPSVIYVHGFQPQTIARRFRESLNWRENDDCYGLDINAADHWIEAGWNVGVWYWNQYADETYVHDAEAKIWTNRSAVHMRYRKLVPSTGDEAPTAAGDEVAEDSTSSSSKTTTPSRTSYCYVDSSVPCVSEQLAQALQRRFVNGTTAPYRLVGHSLGSQLVIHASTILAERAREDPSIRLPTRLALLDPFFTPDPKSWLGWRTIATVLYDEIRELSTREHIVLEQYQTSIIGNPASLLGSVTAFFHLNPPHIPWYRLRSRHVAAPYLYFLSFAEELASPIKDLTWNRVLAETTSRLYDLDQEGDIGSVGERLLPRRTSGDDLRALAKAPDEALRLLMHATAWDELWGIFGLELDQ